MNTLDFHEQSGVGYASRVYSHRERESAMMHDKNYHLKVTVSQQCGEHLREMLNTSCDTSKTPSWMF